MEENKIDENKKSKKWVWVIGVTVAIIVIILLAKMLGGGSSGAAVSSLDNLPSMVGGC